MLHHGLVFGRWSFSGSRAAAGVVVEHSRPLCGRADLSRRFHACRTPLPLLLLLVLACDTSGDNSATAAPAAESAITGTTSTTCDLPMLDPPLSKPADACRTGTTILGPNILARTSGPRNTAAWPFSATESTASCVYVENAPLVCHDDPDQGDEHGDDGDDDDGHSGDRKCGGNQGGDHGRGGNHENQRGHDNHGHDGHNGGGHERHCRASKPVTSGWIGLDQQIIVGPSRFRHAPIIEQRVALSAGSHELEAILKGAPGEAIAVSLKSGGTLQQHNLARGNFLELFDL